MDAQVRAILWQHLYAHGKRWGQQPPEGDPNDLLSATDFSQALRHHEDHLGPGSLDEAARAYVALWARTFRNLVRQFRGRPERALHVFVSEVYPYLLGKRLAARIEKRQGRMAEVLLESDLPAEYTQGLLAAFIGLSGASTAVATLGGGRFEIQWRMHPTDRLVALSHHLAAMRVPLLVTSLLAALVGTALAAGPMGRALPWLSVLAVLSGTLAAQSGANALHDLFGTRPRNALGGAPLSRGWSWFQAIGSYTVAATALAYLVWSGRPGLLAYGAMGLGLGVMYRRLRDRGWGPAIAALTHGPLTVWGTAHAFSGTAIFDIPLTAAMVVMPTGLLAAAILFLDDLADRPLDEAAGKRTLVVRLPRRRHVVVFASLLTLGTAAAWSWISMELAPASRWVAWLLAFVATATVAWLITQVRRNLDDPRGLAPARMGTATLYVAASAGVVLAWIGGMP